MKKKHFLSFGHKSSFVHFFQRIGIRTKNIFLDFIRAITPDDGAWKGASLGISIITLVVLLVVGALQLKNLGVLVVSGFILYNLVMGIAAAFGLFLAIKIILVIPWVYRWSLVAVVFILIELWVGTIQGKLAITAVTLVPASLIGAIIWVIIHKGWTGMALWNKILNGSLFTIGLAGLVIGSVWLFKEGVNADTPGNAALKNNCRPEQLIAMDPSLDGDYTVLELYYGSGKDRHRKEFAEDVNIKTDSVDGSRFVSSWEKFHGWARTKYWRFDEKSLPLNARVWYPGGKGPFPLVLCVHGNHLDRDYSDPGYEYLGRLMASRGFIFVSVDENFLNGTWSNIFKQLEEENDCRAWLLLKHLELWHKWNEDEKNPFFGNVDTNNIALIGHSRGGEAVSITAAFNRLPFYPDDGTVPLNFKFDIKSVIAIAPVDGQYKPANTGTAFENVNYFVLQGSHDMDMQSYHGVRQFNRITFTDDKFHVKAGLYIWGANHGQFNSIWGRRDVSYPGFALYNRKQILPETDQEKIAKVYISAFLEATLKDKKEYLAIFRDYRKGLDWLPQTIYLNQYEDTDCEFICTYEEDINLETITCRNGTISMENLTVWKERLVPLKWGPHDTRAVFAGWNQEVKDTLIASYSVKLDKVLKRQPNLNNCLVFSLAESTESSNPNTEKDMKGNNISVNNLNIHNSILIVKTENTLGVDTTSEETEEETKEPIDFAIMLRDSNDQEAQLPLSHYAFLQRQLEAKIMKADFMNDNAKSEIVFQTFFFPLKDFCVENPDFNPAAMREIRFIFNRTVKGVVVIDNIGFWHGGESNYQ